MSHRPGHAHRPIPWLGLALALLLGGTALAGPALLAVDPLEQDLLAAGAPPGAEWWLGTDALGRSILARTVAAAPLSLGLALAASAASGLLGLLAGLAAAALHGLPRRLLLGLATTIYACPALLLVLLAAELLGGGAGTVLAGLVLTRWPAFAQLCEPLARAALAAPQAEASLLLGFGPAYRLRRHAAPALARPLLSLAALQLGGNLLTVSSLGFLGIGLLPPRPEWGGMIAEALPYLQDSPHMLAAPAAAIFLATWCATLLGEALAGEPPRAPVGEEA
ncbi:ABC transporter permease subunit [Roseomonas sp. GC11]|uniref:ABC transporter permease subunit n=1 Tax=Roseomonas sp. GC11 TaxID=2950546 RepID=UPI00210C5BB4|nr:ABC transporter permease subunit [Roseomonas sp. GC11]MCQ4162378.1 ABC transporter permease subunit [Roseomonas sp. GC11]